MALSMYQASVPVFVKMLTNLKGILQRQPRTRAGPQDRRGPCWSMPACTLTRCRRQADPDRQRLSRAAPPPGSPAPSPRRTKTTKDLGRADGSDRSHDRIFAHQESGRRSTARKDAKSCEACSRRTAQVQRSQLPASVRAAELFSTRRPPTRSCATTASKSASWTVSARWTDLG